jgi:predicted protein tyrosine phosphatase
MNIQIFGETELVVHLGHGGGHYSHCISIRDPNLTMPDIIHDSFASILELKFLDVDTDLGSGFQKSPQLEDIKSVINYFKETKKEATGYTIHCRVGVSRSPAVGLGIAYMITKSETAARDMLLKVVHPRIINPNIRIVRFFDEILGSKLTPIAMELKKESEKAITGMLVNLFQAKSENKP